MSRTILFHSVLAAVCLMFASLAGAADAKFRLAVIDAEMGIRAGELELRVSELSVKEAAIEFEKHRVHLEAVRKEGSPNDVAIVELELQQAEIQVEMRKARTELARMQIDRAKAELEHLHALHQEREGESEHEEREREHNQERERDRDRRHADEHPEARAAAQQIEIMQTALTALREAEREELVGVLKLAIQARQVRLRGLEGEEARYVLEREPSRGNTAEILMHAAHLWEEFGNERNARLVAQLAERMANRERDREIREPEARNSEREHLQNELAELEAIIDRSQARMEELRRELED